MTSRLPVDPTIKIFYIIIFITNLDPNEYLTDNDFGLQIPNRLIMSPLPTTRSNNAFILEYKLDPPTNTNYLSFWNMSKKGVRCFLRIEYMVE